MAMATASADTTITKSLTEAPDRITAPAHPTSFASLPREIRDEIYGLVLPCSQTLDFRSVYPMPRDSLTPRMESCRILATHVSGHAFAREACMVFFQNNTIRVSEAYLPRLLSQDPFNELASFYMYYSHPYGVPMIQLDLKALIRRITIVLDSEQQMDGLAQSVSLLLTCTALWEVGVFIWKHPGPMKHIIGSISDAFMPLEEEKGCRLRICVDSLPSTTFPPIEDAWSGENVFSNVKELEDAVRDKESEL